MAIFDPARQGQAQAPNAIFQALNEQMQAYRQAQQIQREQQAISKLRGQGLLGVKTAGLFDATTGKLNLSAGDAMTTKQHYEALSTELGDKEMKKVFGRTATADDVKGFIKGEQRKRDLEILNAIDLRMKELDTDNIYKVIEKGDSSFKNWYDTTDQETKLKLLEAGYHPELKEGFGTLGMERRRAQGKFPIGFGEVAQGAGLIGASALGSRFIPEGVKTKAGEITRGVKARAGFGPLQLTEGRANIDLSKINRDLESGKISGAEAKKLSKTPVSKMSRLQKTRYMISKLADKKSRSSMLNLIKKKAGSKIATRIGTGIAGSAIPYAGLLSSGLTAYTLYDLADSVLDNEK